MVVTILITCDKMCPAYITHLLDSARQALNLIGICHNQIDLSLQNSMYRIPVNASRFDCYLFAIIFYYPIFEPQQILNYYAEAFGLFYTIP